MTAEINSPAAVPASTLILVREKQGQLQTYLLKRSSKSGFMANLHVFPGGSLDRPDYDKMLWQHHGDLHRQQISRNIAAPRPLAEAAAHAIAAIRECAEEAGVIFGHSQGKSVEDIERFARQAQSADRAHDWFVEAIKREGWILELSALHRWSHWITPPQMERRYDTRFFIAEMPAGQTCRPDGNEAVDGIWIGPGQALTGNLSGRVPLSPPTLVTLNELLTFEGLDDVLAVARDRQWGTPVQPRLVRLECGPLILEPWDPAYHQSEIWIESHLLESAILGVGEPFSRLWYSDGLWRPVGVC